ncbi:hypothetical protein WH47_05851 [Habropoda laboriosa]|uniref:Uncharacterized protein n=1 Tax=Habropoda laboriosa TaxID=597456 RepID=A0A0L7QTI0_9HYME|nr:PREDICTED: uncharacterized protein LOC108575392 [Habropoda laboriosa]KOC61962.1 hypothetical protein WH47_05851 [Habropoda laboriosa]
MENSIKLAVTLLLFSMVLSCKSQDNNAHKTTKRSHSKIFGKHPSNGLITFNSEDQKLRIDWAVTIPFISIPFDHKIGEHGEVSPLLNVNTKALGIVGLMTTLFTVVSPLFSKKHHQFNYRSEDNTQWLQMGNTINEMIFGNNYVAPCMQRIVCSVVSVAMNTDNPTSTDKIIDGLSSHKWFKDVTNGTIIQDAVVAARKGNHNCAHIYKECSITPKLLNTMMNEFGIV